jgi:sugar lactone lactonase YvrE
MRRTNPAFRLAIVVAMTLAMLMVVAVPALAAPKVNAISPAKGPAVGGTTVTITGEGFEAGSTVKFGSVPATSATVNSSTSITVKSPSAAGTVPVTVTNSEGTSALVPGDEFTYQWLGLNSNSGGGYWGGRNLTDFTSHNVIYDRGTPVEFTAGDLPSSNPTEQPPRENLWRSIESGMTPIVPIEFSTYDGRCMGESLPESGYLPTGAAITTYAEGFVKSAKAIREMFPGKKILFEVINEPWCAAKVEYGNPEQYAAIVAKVLPAAEAAGLPLEDIYVAATGRGCKIVNGARQCTSGSWIPRMYEAEPTLKTLIKGWYFHPYGPPTGTFFNEMGGIEIVANARPAMTSGQNNIIVSEVGFCTPDVGSCDYTGGYPYVPNSAQAATDLERVLATARAYHQAGWLKGLLVYSRHAYGWAAQVEGGALSAQGKVLTSFGDILPPALNTNAVIANVSPQAPGLQSKGINGAVKEVVYQGTDHGIWVRYFDQAGYWHTERIGGQASAGTSPAVLRDPTSMKQWIYYRGSDNTVRQFEWTGSSWVGSSIGGAPRADASPAVLRDAATGKRWIYFVNTSSTISQVEWTGSTWSTTTLPSPGVAGANLSAARDASTGIRWVVYTDLTLGRMIWNGSWENQVFSEFGASAYNRFDTTPSAVSHDGNGWIYYADRATDNLARVYTWAEWSRSVSKVGMRPGSSPSAALGLPTPSYPDGLVTVYFVASNGRLDASGTLGEQWQSNAEVRQGSDPSAMYTFWTPSGGETIHDLEVAYVTNGGWVRTRQTQRTGNQEEVVGSFEPDTTGPPENVAKPALKTTTPVVGSADSVSTGTWIGAPGVFTFQWSRCNANGENCDAIPAATDSTYVPSVADQGSTLRAVVQSQNNEGSEAISSETSAVVAEASATSQIPTYTSSFGSLGAGNGQFNKPADAAVDAAGNIWVADRENNRLQKFNAKGEYLSQLGSKGSGDGQFEKPWGVAIDASGNIWVADSGNGRVQKFNSSGAFLLKSGSKGSGNGQFSTYGPRGIATDPAGNVWVSDYSGRIQKFSSAGTFLQAVGSYGSGNGQFQQSAGIDVGPEGKVWVADWELNRVSVFSSAGSFLFKFGATGSGNGQLNHPDGVEVDTKGNVWVNEEGNSRVQGFNQSGEYVTKFGSNGSGAGQFKFAWPSNLTSDDKGNLWIADVNNHRVQRWSYLP